MHPAWAPDGTRLVFVSDRDGLDHLWIREFADGAAIGQARQLTRGERTDRFPSWSPDGTQIAFLGDLRGREEVWVVDVDKASDPRPVTAGAQGLFVRWDPDGRSLWVAGRWGTDSAEIRRIDLDDGSAIPSATRIVLNSVEATAGFDISDDRRFIALSWQTVRGDIWIAEAGGGASF
jgi:Tol biopolymer transport system component